MIQALNSVNTTSNCCGGKRKQSFGETAAEQQVANNTEKAKINPRKKSAFKGLASYTATQFAAGALVSGIIDGGVNLWRAAFKNHPLIPLKQIGGNAAYWGAAFAVIGLVFTAISGAMARKNK